MPSFFQVRKYPYTAVHGGRSLGGMGDGQPVRARCDRALTLAAVVLGETAARFGSRDDALDLGPLGVAQVG